MLARPGLVSASACARRQPLDRDASHFELRDLAAESIHDHPHAQGDGINDLLHFDFSDEHYADDARAILEIELNISSCSDKEFVTGSSSVKGYKVGQGTLRRLVASF